jgi:hypothetical protein
MCGRLVAEHSDPAARERVTYITVSSEAFFLGVVALFNSLQLTHNAGRFIVLDAGLTPEQRMLLVPHAEIVSVKHIGVTPDLRKAWACNLEPTGTLAFIDSDMIVTGSLDHVMALARDGQICAYQDHAAVRWRWFPEWASMLELRASLRREIYINTGFVVFNTEAWPRLLERWWEVCNKIPPERMWRSGSPFEAPDQDALNALLMSEVPAGAATALDPGEVAFGGDAAIDDIASLAAGVDGHLKTLVHFLDRPKPWERNGWIRLAGIDYVRLMRRLLFWDDVPIRVDPATVPIWLRPTRLGDTTLRVLGAANRAIVAGAHALPPPVTDRLRQVRRRMMGAGDPTDRRRPLGYWRVPAAVCSLEQFPL